MPHPSQVVRRLDVLTGEVSTLAGIPRLAGSANGLASNATFGAGGPWGLVVYGTDVLVADPGARGQAPIAAAVPLPPVSSTHGQVAAWDGNTRLPLSPQATPRCGGCRSALVLPR